VKPAANALDKRLAQAKRQREREREREKAEAAEANPGHEPKTGSPWRAQNIARSRKQGGAR
jgi:hypothetical protein